MSLALPPRTARTAATGVALALALGLTGCGSGLRAQTYQERTAADSTNEAVGSLDLRDLRVLAPAGGSDAYPVGSDARVTLVVVNQSSQADRLTALSTDGASSVAVVGPNGAPTQLSVPARSTGTGASFVLRGLTRELRPGNYVQLQLTFAVNGSTTLLVPVEVTGSPAPQRSGYEIPEPDSAGNVPQESQGPG